MIEIIPAIMPGSVQDIEDKLSYIVREAPLVQLDIMDGKFVKPKTWPYVHNHGAFEALATQAEGLPLWEKCDFEIDLMVAHPEEVIEDWIIVGAKRIVVHIESTKKVDEIIKKFNERFARDPETKQRDVELGLALNILTSSETIVPYLKDIDFVQFMGIDRIGYQGESFDQNVIDKIRDFHNAHPEIIVSIDGGVSLETAPSLIKAGTSRLVSGSAVFESANIKATIEAFKTLF